MPSFHHFAFAILGFVLVAAAYMKYLRGLAVRFQSALKLESLGGESLRTSETFSPVMAPSGNSPMGSFVGICVEN